MQSLDGRVFWPTWPTWPKFGLNSLNRSSLLVCSCSCKVPWVRAYSRGVRQAELPRQGWWRVMEQAEDNSSFRRDHRARRGHLDLVGEYYTNACTHYVLPHGLQTPGFEPGASAWLAFVWNCVFHCLHVDNCWCQNNLGWGLGPTVLLTSDTGRKGDGQSECTYSATCLCCWPSYISQQKGQWVYKREREKWRLQHTVGQIIDILFK